MQTQKPTYVCTRSFFSSVYSDMYLQRNVKDVVLQGCVRQTFVFSLPDFQELIYKTLIYLFQIVTKPSLK